MSNHRTAMFIACLLLSGCPGSQDDPLTLNQSCEGGAIGLDGKCTDIDPEATVYRIDQSEVSMDATSELPTAGVEVDQSGTAGEVVAEACCVFAVWNANGFPYYQDPYGTWSFTGACPLPYPWTPGAFGCTCLGYNTLVDPYSGFVSTLYANWNGFTCVVD